ncbi:hypothetical protein A3K86_04445 [Photobacterium jeanii]|uniref:Uncharacterized protein n=1 Tax=Photobacterium jeanii TaxID=858640 RepID=A0A178KMD0_9GAMM|nr:hypothetical protein [Photobacterium jeanii]OAN18155.1 hypothetical protein A3K86_04445 [Photobacterium jeanii]PST92169.1 hypothetical protein C9I91_03030 [Photobacterium jeanii]
MRFLICTICIFLSYGCASQPKDERLALDDNKIITRFNAAINSFDFTSDVILYKGRLTQKESIVFTPWKDLYGAEYCAQLPEAINTIIVVNRSSNSVHHIESCGELDAADMMIYAIPSAEVEALIPNIKVHAKESIKVPTEASVDTYLIWNGQKYVFTGPDETA